MKPGNMQIDLNGFNNINQSNNHDFQHKEKIEQLNLLPICDEIWPYLETIQPCKKGREKKFDYVRIFSGELFFYTEKYLNEHTLDEIVERFCFNTPQNAH